MNEPSEAEKLKYWEADDPMTKKILSSNSAERQVREVIEPPAGAAAGNRGGTLRAAIS